MMTLPKEPVNGESVSISWGRDVVRCLRALVLQAGPGLSVEYGPGGQRVGLRRTLPASVAALPGKPWDVVFHKVITTPASEGVDEVADHTATFSNCCFRRDTWTLLPRVGGVKTDELTYEMPTGTSPLYLGWMYNQRSGEAEIISGAGFDDVSEQTEYEFYADRQLVRTPLYKVVFTTSWSWTASYREAIQLGMQN